MKNFYFIRHGQTKWNALKRLQGQLDSSLNDQGRDQADANGRFLAQQKLDKLIVSPLGRTLQTAEIINRHAQLPLETDERIKEWDCGDWSGQYREEVQAKWPVEWQAWQSDKFNYRGPSCENYPDMLDRVWPFLDTLMASSSNNVGIVSHGVIGRVMIAALMKMTPQQTVSFSLDNDVIVRVTMRGDSCSLDHYMAGNGPISGLPAW